MKRKERKRKNKTRYNKDDLDRKKDKAFKNKKRRLREDDV